MYLIRTSLSRAFHLLGRRRCSPTRVCPLLLFLCYGFLVAQEAYCLSSPTLSDADTCPPLDEFRELIGAQSAREIRQLEPSQWDIRSEYQDVVDAVAKAAASSGGAVKVYRVGGEGSRVEYFVVGVDSSERTIVGARVLAIES